MKKLDNKGFQIQMDAGRLQNEGTLYLPIQSRYLLSFNNYVTCAQQLRRMAPSLRE